LASTGGASALGALYGKRPAVSSAYNLATKPSRSERDKLVTAFNRKLPLGGYQSRVSSWSDPISAWGTLEEEADRKIRKRRGKTQMRRRSSSGGDGGDEDESDESEGMTRVLTHGPRR
jgi:hypothetical protein